MYKNTGFVRFEDDTDQGDILNHRTRHDRSSDFKIKRVSYE